MSEEKRRNYANELYVKLRNTSNDFRKKVFEEDKYVINHIEELGIYEFICLALREKIKSDIKRQHQLYPGQPPTIEELIPKVAAAWIPEIEELLQKYPGLTKEIEDADTET